MSERKIRVNWLPPSSDDTNGVAPAAVRTPNKQASVNGAVSCCERILRNRSWFLTDVIVF